MLEARFSLRQKAHQLGSIGYLQKAPCPRQLNTSLHQYTVAVVVANMPHAAGSRVQMYQEHLRQEIHDLKSPKGLFLAALLNVREIHNPRRQESHSGEWFP